ncbi:MAG: bacteriohemerythrin [Peptococcaceae bacterium]|nr:bacteriohemerythrin [Peptococcaceae bacterium]
MLKKIKDRMYFYLISEDTPMHGRLFNMIMLLSFAGSIVGSIVTLVESTSLMTVAATAWLPFTLLLAIVFVNKTQNYRLGSLLVSVTFCVIGFPFIFFSSGGIYSGMLAYMLLGAVVISVLLNGVDFIVLMGVYITVTIASFFIQSSGLILVTPIEPEILIYMDVAVSFLVASLLIGLVLKYQQREYVSAQKAAEAASRSKSDFLSNMSHEMRTPMNAIIGMTAIGKSALDMEQKDYAFKKIEDASTHLLGVINDILDMSKIEANKLELSFSEFDFEKMLQKTVNVINFRVDERKQNFTVHIDKNIPRSLIGDDQRLAQVVANLLSNAVKFTPEGGSIRLNADLVREEEGVCVVQIEVSDTGIGISEEQQAMLFTSFQQAENSTSRKFGGTGLGLAISKRIVEMMGGKIWIESELGKGAAFIFYIQARRGSEETQGRLNPGVNWKNIRILAVDDSSEMREYFREIIQRFGGVCDVAASGEEAMERVKRDGPYDVYFVDWSMPPGMDGVELARRIKAYETDKSIVMMMSSTEWSAIEEEAKQAGIDKFLPKPLFPSDILDCVNTCLGIGSLPSETDGSADETDCFKGFQILLAEDVEINREIVLTLLEPTGLVIDCALNGVEAVRMFSDQPERYHMIFMDIQMPEMDGYEATRTIRALNVFNAKTIPIIAMTANVFREDIEKCLASGMNDHVGKPLDINEVIAKLHEYLEKTDDRPSARSETAAQTDSAPPETAASEWKYGVAWSRELETGNEAIDAQHKELFRLTSDLADMCGKGQDSEALGKALDFLASYTVKHFADEESLQLKYRYPDYENHKKLHDDFKETATQLIAEYKASGSADELSNKVYSVIVHWLVRHIKGEDAKIAAHIRNSAATSARQNH